MKIMHDKRLGVVSILGLSYPEFNTLCCALSGSRLDLVSHTRHNARNRTVNVIMLNWDQVTLITAVLVDQLRLVNDLVVYFDTAIEMDIT